MGSPPVFIPARITDFELRTFDIGDRWRIEFAIDNPEQPYAQKWVDPKFVIDTPAGPAFIHQGKTYLKSSAALITTGWGNRGGALQAFAVTPSVEGLTYPSEDRLSKRAKKRLQKKKWRDPDRNRGERKSEAKPIIAVDGEGETNPDGKHIYIYMAAASEDGQIWETHDPRGLSTIRCLEFILGLPDEYKIFGYSLGYDLTMMLKDLDDWSLYSLLRPETRIGENGFKPIRWDHYSLGLMNKQFTIRRGNERRVVWDIFSFYASSFVAALRDWKIIDESKIKVIESMKLRRNRFRDINRREIFDYCKSEVQCLASLGRTLIDSHDSAGLTLKAYHGAGSTASVLLQKWDIKTKKGPWDSLDPGFRDAISHAFFGGRFENSRIGPVPGPVYSYDINSAYPYHTTFLPCLECARWRLAEYNVQQEIERSRHALIQWWNWEDADHPTPPTDGAWGPLPVRMKNGTIIFPLYALGGWIWKSEFLNAQRVEPRLLAKSAWIYESDCDHRPFAEMPAYYRRRVELGKDGPGLVIKLGMNSVYGKLAQSKGRNPPFQSWIWASLITSNTRAQLLESLLLVEDRWNILSFATDGVTSLVPLKFSPPLDTGTSDLPKCLGGWDSKIMEKGTFYIRPGMHFPIEPTEDEFKIVRGRGVGRKALYDKAKDIVDAYSRGERKICISVPRFFGAKTSISVNRKNIAKRGRNYGQWKTMDIEVTFEAAPKRGFIEPDGKLLAHPAWGKMSEKYNRTLVSPEAAAIRGFEAIVSEQPDIGAFGDLDSVE